MVSLNDKGVFTGSLLLISLVAAVIALALFGWLADEVMRGATLRFDLAIRSAVHGLSSRQLTAVMLIITSMGSTIFLLAATGLALV
ncbi:MAG TPA: hypothetical protein VKB56_07955, partial [Terriglobales bacterium]|nr:hypothetical protein [Terriglobales bacterium]